MAARAAPFAGNCIHTCDTTTATERRVDPSSCFQIHIYMKLSSPKYLILFIASGALLVGWLVMHETAVPKNVAAVPMPEVQPTGMHSALNNQPTDKVQQTLPLAGNAHAQPLLPTLDPQQNLVANASTANASAALSESAEKKLDASLKEAMKGLQGRGSADGFDVRPLGIIAEGGRILVDLEAEPSEELLSQIAKGDGKVLLETDSQHPFRAMIPLSQLGALAARGDVKAITTGQLMAWSGIQARPPSANETSPTQPQ